MKVYELIYTDNEMRRRCIIRGDSAQNVVNKMRLQMKKDGILGDVIRVSLIHTG